VSDNSKSCDGLSHCIKLTFGGCSCHGRGGWCTARVLVLGLNGCLGFPLCLYEKVTATNIGLRHCLQVWLSILQRVQRFSFFRFSTTSSLVLSWSFFQSVCSSFAVFVFLFFAVLFRGVFHRDDPFLALLSDPFFSYFVLKPLSDSSRFRLGGAACGVVRDLVNFPLSRSSSSYLLTFLKIFIHSLSVANPKWDRQSKISWGSLLSTQTLHTIPVSPALMLRYSRRRRYVSIFSL